MVNLVAETPLPPQPASAQEARATVCTALAGWPTESLGTAALIASELVTNAVRHAGPPLVLRILIEPGFARLEVRDTSGSVPQVHAEPSDELAPSGRGMLLVDALGDAWGVDPIPGDGKTVWCQVRR